MRRLPSAPREFLIHDESGLRLVPCCAERIAAPAITPLEALATPVESERERARRARGMLSGYTDAHTHLFPESFYRSLWSWFDAHAWSIAFRGDAEAVLGELARSGATRIVALVYAHKPGAARYLNRYLGDLCRAAPQVLGVGTVLPGEPDAREVVREAIDVHGLRGIKLHCHVQRMPIDDPRVVDVLRQCAEERIPAVVHCGREPATSAYGIDPRAICHVDRARNVLRELPSLKLLVPHLGADEFVPYLELAREHEGLYLDTSMSCADYFPQQPPWRVIEAQADRVMYGSDFPIVPYEVDREVRVLARRIESDDALERILRGTAEAFWGA